MHTFCLPLRYVYDRRIGADGIFSCVVFQRLPAAVSEHEGLHAVAPIANFQQIDSTFPSGFSLPFSVASFDGKTLLTDGALEDRKPIYRCHVVAAAVAAAKACRTAEEIGHPNPTGRTDLLQTVASPTKRSLLGYVLEEGWPFESDLLSYTMKNINPMTVNNLLFLAGTVSPDVRSRTNETRVTKPFVGFVAVVNLCVSGEQKKVHLKQHV